MAVTATTSDHTTEQAHWDALAAKARLQRRTGSVLLYSFLILVSLPVMVPYFWLGTLAFSARLESVNTDVLWQSVFHSGSGGHPDLDLVNFCPDTSTGLRGLGDNLDRSGGDLCDPRRTRTASQ